VELVDGVAELFSGNLLHAGDEASFGESSRVPSQDRGIPGLIQQFADRDHDLARVRLVEVEAGRALFNRVEKSAESQRSRRGAKSCSLKWREPKILIRSSDQSARDQNLVVEVRRGRYQRRADVDAREVMPTVCRCRPRRPPSIVPGDRR